MRGSLSVKLAEDLDRIYGSVPAAGWASYTEVVERYIENELVVYVLDAVKEGEDGFVRASHDSFVIDGVVHKAIAGARDPLHADVLALVVVDLNEPANLVHSYCDVRGSGRYRKLEVFVPQRLARYRDSIADTSKELIETGYAWLSQILLAKTRELESSMVVELYRAIRIAFSEKPELANLVWLGVVQRDRGFYLFDGHQAEQTIRDLRLRGRAGGESAVSLYLGLLTSNIAFDEMFSRDAPEGECIRCDVKEAKYAGSTPLCALAEYVLYQTDYGKPGAMSILQIAKTEQPFLTALFPTIEEANILPTLRANDARIKRVFSEQKRLASSVVARTERALKRLPAGDMAELLGRFLKGLSPWS